MVLQAVLSVFLGVLALDPHAPTLALSPDWGVAGATIEADVTGYNCPDEDLIGKWDNKPLTLKGRTFTVPSADPGAHIVNVVCKASRTDLEKNFMVVAAQSNRRMAVPGAKVTVSGKGFLCTYGATSPADVSVDWLGPITADANGGFTISGPVPQVTPGHYQLKVDVACAARALTVATVPLHVPQLEAKVDSGQLQLSGTGFDCAGASGGYAGPADVTWDDTSIGDAATDADGRLSRTLPMPSGAAEGEHRVGVSCRDLPLEGVSALVQVTGSPALIIAPPTGTVTTQVLATGSGFSCPAVDVRWEGDQGHSAPVSDGAFVARLDVPAQSRFGDLTLTAGCAGGRPVSQTFSLIPRTPRLTVTPDPVRVGGRVTLTGLAFDCGELAGSTAKAELAGVFGSAAADVDGSGRFQTEQPVPADAVTGPGEVVARCVDAPSRSARAPLTVTVPPKPSIATTWSRGERGIVVPVSGTGFGCPRVDLLWDAKRVATVETSGGAFAHDLLIPEETGGHTVTGQCAGSVEVAARAPFEVLPETVIARASMVLDPVAGPARTTVTAVGRGFPLGCGTALLRFDGAAVDLLKVDHGRHALLVEFDVPTDAARGPHTVELTCQLSATQTFTVPVFWPRSLLATSLRAPADVSLQLEHVVGSLIISGLIILLIGFPAEVFNKAYENSRGRAGRSQVLSKVRAGLAKLPAVVQFGLFSVATALLLAYAGPEDERNWITALGLFVAVVLTSLTFSVIIEVFIRWASGAPGRLRVLPGALLIAFICAAVSTWLELYPGYVYGLIVTFVLVRGGKEIDRGSTENKGRAVLVGAVGTLALSVMAWLAWIPIDDAADRGSTHLPTLIADVTLASIFLMGVQTVLFGLIPLAFLDGYLLSRWSWGLWGACVFASVVAFVHIAYAEQAEKAMQLNWPDVGRMFTVFVIAGVLSLTFWAYVRVRHAIKSRA